METRTLSVIVLPDNARIFDEKATVISIEDEAAGEYVKVHQCHDATEDGTILIDPNEWPAIRDAIERMIGQCRKET